MRFLSDMRLYGASLLLILFFSQAALSSGLDREYSLSVISRVDELDWNIAGNTSGTSPNILSELTWTDLESLGLEIKGSAPVNNRMYLRGSFRYSWIYSGANQDSDYSGNNRTQEYSRSNNNSDSGSVWDASGGLGFVLLDGPFFIAPVGGFSYHKQNLTITDGFQTIPATGPFAGLNSTYEARWFGPWAGLDLWYTRPRSRSFTLSMSLEYHVLWYRAEADWNLRSDFSHPKSFEHWATGNGILLTIDSVHRLKSGISINYGIDVRAFMVHNGTDRVYFSSGAISDTKLNEVNWTSSSIYLGLGYAF